MLLGLLIGLAGAVLGAYLARKRKGKILDILQYAGVYFMAFGVLGVLLNTVLLRIL